MRDSAARRVAVVDGGYGRYDIERKILAATGATLDCVPSDVTTRAGRMAFARGAVGLLVRGSMIDSEFLDAAPSVTSVVRYGIGYDNIDLDAATRRGVLVCNVRGYANQSVSDHALALILSCVRGLRQGQQQLRSHYGAPPRTHVPDLRDLSLGIVGLGRIGGTLSVKARGLFKRVLACDPYIPAERFAELGAEALDFDALLPASDVISIHCNLTEETRLLFDRAALARMRPNAILINTARGPVVDEEALLDALQEERLYGAGIDVFWDEPPGADRDELLAHPHFVGTGHYAWFSTEASLDLRRRAAGNMAALLSGEIPEDTLNAPVGESESER